jgi:hypothetical protein
MPSTKTPATATRIQTMGLTFFTGGAAAGAIGGGAGCAPELLAGVPHC